MYRDNMLALLQAAAVKLERDGVTPLAKADGYDAEADALLALLRDTPLDDLRVEQ